MSSFCTPSKVCHYSTVQSFCTPSEACHYTTVQSFCTPSKVCHCSTVQSFCTPSKVCHYSTVQSFCTPSKVCHHNTEQSFCTPSKVCHYSTVQSFCTPSKVRHYSTVQSFCTPSKVCHYSTVQSFCTPSDTAALCALFRTGASGNLCHSHDSTSKCFYCFPYQTKLPALSLSRNFGLCQTLMDSPPTHHLPKITPQSRDYGQRYEPQSERNSLAIVSVPVCGQYWIQSHERDSGDTISTCGSLDRKRGVKKKTQALAIGWAGPPRDTYTHTSVVQRLWSADYPLPPFPKKPYGFCGR